MLTFLATTWLWIVLIGAMAVRHLGHRIHKPRGWRWWWLWRWRWLRPHGSRAAS